MDYFLYNLSKFAAVLVAIVGGVVLAGWALDSTVLKSILPQYVSMKFNTAISLLLAGVALLLGTTGSFTSKKRLAANICGYIVTLIGALTLLEYIAGINFGIDELFFKDPAALLTSNPGRMSPLTAANFVAAGIAIFLLGSQSRTSRWFSLLLAFFIGAISYFVFLTYSYNVISLGKLSSYTQMALHTSASFLLLSFALLMVPYRDRGVWVYLTNRGMSGAMMRRLWPSILVTPAFLGWLLLIGEERGFYNTEFGIALLITAIVIVATSHVFWVARLIYGLELKQVNILRELEHTNTLNESLCKTIPFGVQVVDRSKKILFMNSVMETMLGSSAMGRRCYEILKDDREPCQNCPYSEDLKPHETKAIEARGVLGGKTFEISHTNMAFDGQEAVMEVFHDITDRKNAEEALNRAHVELLHAYGEIKDLSDKKSEIVSMVSHELRSPLTTIKEGIALVMDGVAGDVNDKQKKMLDMAETNLDRLVRLINDVLDVQKIESGRTVLNKERFELTEAIRQAANAFESRILAKGLSLKFGLKKPGITVNADRDKIIQIFTNLIGNAAKFTETGYIEISAKEIDGAVECSVSDTGRGIAEKDIKDVFTAFKQFGGGVTNGEKGSGLGLSIVRSLVELHGGRVWVESSLGKGSKFTFIIPIQK